MGGRRLVALAAGAWFIAACGDDGQTGPDAWLPPDAMLACEGTAIGPGEVVELGTVARTDEQLLSLPARALTPTSWDTLGAEALILDVAVDGRVIGQLLMHQGVRRFAYTMTLGALDAGAKVTAAISPRSATTRPIACVGDASLTPGADLGDAAEGLANAPIFVWPSTKRFDDVPLVLGWSKATQGYEVIYTNENGGTTTLCGDPIVGMQLLYARWGRGSDVERIWQYGPPPARWLRCTMRSTVDDFPVRMEDAHPVLYYGDGHNNLFEDRSGYGATCGRGIGERSDGQIPGWNTENPGNDVANDAAVSVILRPAPIDLDATGYAMFGGRREAMADLFAPWIYRVTAEELAREGKIDGVHSLALDQYLYVDVHAAGVDGGGDAVCGLAPTQGFELDLLVDQGPVPAQVPGVRMTGRYFGGDDAWKRLALPLPAGVEAADVRRFVFDAFDADGIYLLELGDAFRVVADDASETGVTLDFVRMGAKTVGAYVDDDDTDCVDGVNTGSPTGEPVPCATSVIEVEP